LGASPTEGEAVNFESWVLAKFIENDYALIRKIRGTTSVIAYLAVVAGFVIPRDFRVQPRGPKT